MDSKPRNVLWIVRFGVNNHHFKLLFIKAILSKNENVSQCRI
jgi:hypothetical protein